MPRPIFIVCNPVSTNPVPFVKTARRERCSQERCGQEVWLSPSAFIHALSMPILCVPCAVARAIVEGNPLDPLPATEPQIAEIVVACNVSEATARACSNDIVRWMKEGTTTPGDVRSTMQRLEELLGKGRN